MPRGKMLIAERLVRLIDRLHVRPVAWLLPRQTFRYAVCGAGNVVLGWLLYFLVYHFVLRKQFVDLGFVTMSPHVAALTIIFPFTFLSGFWLNRYVTFRWSPLTGRTQLVRYALSVAGSVLLNYVCLKLLVEICGLWATPSQVVSSCIVMIYSYLAAKFYTFRDAAE